MTAIFTSSEATEFDPISFDRCVDWLITLHNSSPDPALRRLVLDVLDDIREIGPIEGEFEEVVLGALASVETAFELAEAAA